MMKGGFTYRGTHSSKFGVFCVDSSRVAAPAANTSNIRIPGRSGTFDQSDGTWSMRQETYNCIWRKPKDMTAPQLIRDIAGWLGYPGELVFDSEPDKRYRGKVTSAPPVERHLASGDFSFTFEANHPFAYESAQDFYFTVTNSNPIQMPVGGTVQTPVRIHIKNTGTTTIGTLTLERYATRV
jgi:predicted phage tail component-like protein